NPEFIFYICNTDIFSRKIIFSGLWHFFNNLITVFSTSQYTWIPVNASLPVFSSVIVKIIPYFGSTPFFQRFFRYFGFFPRLFYLSSGDPDNNIQKKSIDDQKHPDSLKQYKHRLPPL